MTDTPKLGQLIQATMHVFGIKEFLVVVKDPEGGEEVMTLQQGEPLGKTMPEPPKLSVIETVKH